MTKALLWIALAVSLVLCMMAGHRYWAARSDANASLRQLQRVSDNAREIASLRSAAPPESRRQRPRPGLASRVADVVSKASLPQSSLQSLSPETETQVGGTGLRRQVAKMTLDGMTLPQLGRFLQEWRTAEPAWTVDAIDITPAPTRGRSTPSGDRLLRAVLSIETVFSTSTTQEASH
jgi:hypothetical protein